MKRKAKRIPTNTAALMKMPGHPAEFEPTTDIAFYQR